jgi:hypothetical protein
MNNLLRNIHHGGTISSEIRVAFEARIRVPICTHRLPIKNVKGCFILPMILQ